MGEEFEVKGPHEEVLEGGEGGHGFNNRIAVMTAIMATLGALLSYEASFTLSEAIMFKNEAAIKKTEAANQWNYYQAKSLLLFQMLLKLLFRHLILLKELILLE